MCGLIITSKWSPDSGAVIGVVCQDQAATVLVATFKVPNKEKRSQVVNIPGLSFCWCRPLLPACQAIEVADNQDLVRTFTIKVCNTKGNQGGSYGNSFKYDCPGQAQAASFVAVAEATCVATTGTHSSYQGWEKVKDKSIAVRMLYSFRIVKLPYSSLLSRPRSSCLLSRPRSSLAVKSRARIAPQVRRESSKM